MAEFQNEIITCEVVQDLIPLVCDGIASPDSERLVRLHAEHCEECRQMLELSDMPRQAAEIQPPDDKKILAYIRRRYIIFVCLLMMMGAMVGVLFTGTEFIFQNLLIMPIVGALSYVCFKSKGSAMAVIVFIITALRGFLEYESGMAWFGVIYGVLVLAGVAIAALLGFAFGKNKR